MGTQKTVCEVVAEVMGIDVKNGIVMNCLAEYVEILEKHLPALTKVPLYEAELRNELNTGYGRAHKEIRALADKGASCSMLNIVGLEVGKGLENVFVKYGDY